MRKSMIPMAVFLAMAAAGCATTGTARTPQADIDALNAKLSRLEGELAEKDAQIAKLENRMRQEESARARAEGEKDRLSRDLEAARAQAEAVRRASSARTVSTASDLK